MAPVFQRTAADCFRSCVASVLGVAYEDALDAKYDSWLEDLRAWATARGLVTEWATDPSDVPPDAVCVMGTEWSGDPERSKRGHAVVSRGTSEIIHDPRPGGSEAYGAPMFWIWFGQAKAA